MQLRFTLFLRKKRKCERVLQMATALLMTNAPRP